MFTYSFDSDSERGSVSRTWDTAADRTEDVPGAVGPTPRGAEADGPARRAREARTAAGGDCSRCGGGCPRGPPRTQGPGRVSEADL